MPPKKKARLSSRAASAPAGNASQLIEEPEGPNTAKIGHDDLAGPWTDEQETSLFKSMIRWKPVGWFSYIVIASRTL